MPKAFLTEPHGPRGGASWAVASSKLPGRSITTAYLDLPSADMIAARVLLSAWQAFLTEPHGPGGGASWAVASSKLLGRSITTAYLDLPLADMIAARVLLSAWQAPCQRHS